MSSSTFARGCAADGLTDAVLLGMGGSSLAPEVLWRTFGATDGALALHVLDSTDPAAILAVREQIDLEHTLFVVSTKSGGTIETLSLFEYFHSLVGDGRQFIAITDPGSSLLALAAEHGFREAFENDPNIGGRYSALSLFGLVPAALIGAPIHAMLERAAAAEQSCAHFDSTETNPGLWLGLAIGELARRGRDKLTFVVGDPVSDFGLWVEQLVAESTGKQGRGILPVAGEPLLDPVAYGEDRVFVHLRDEARADARTDALVDALGRAGHPTFTLSVDGSADLGRMFFLAEFATAVAGWVLEINAFDQPNVQEAKDATKRVLAAGPLPELPLADDDAVRALLAGAGPGGYLAVMGYLAPSAEFDEAVAELRATLMLQTRAATTFGYGPRFLHSTGQFHKGGPPVGRFLSLIADEGPDVEIPGADHTFRTLKHAPGARRPADAARSWPRGGDRPPRGRPGRGAARPPPQDQGDALMQIGFVGLGRMGGNMVARIRRDSDHEVVAFDFDPKAIARARNDGRDGCGDAARARQGARAPAHGVGDGPRRRGDAEDGRRAGEAARARTTRSSTAGTRAGSMTRHARSSCARGGSTMSTSVPAAACGASRSATA